MKVKDSTRLWYGQYAYKAVFNDSVRGRLTKWLKDRGNDHTARRYRGTQSYVLFLNREADLDAVIAAFSGEVKEQYRPVSAEVADYMLSNTHVEIRKHLLWNRYRHKIYFRYVWESRGSPALVDFVKNQLESRSDYARNIDWDAYFHSYQPVLYLAHDSDLMMLKMQAQERDIAKITTIKLVSEV